MNSIAKLIASIAAVIASLAFLWIAYTASKVVTGGRIQIDQNVTQYEPYR
jgi:hypothetical protein